MIDAAALDELADRATAVLVARLVPRVSAACAHCGRPFEPARRHPAQRFCAGRCRVGAFRVRARNAREPERSIPAPWAPTGAHGAPEWRDEPVGGPGLPGRRRGGRPRARGAVKEETMPVKRVKSGYRRGETGKIYQGPDAQKKALQQGRAIKAAQLRRSKPPKP